MDTDDDEVATPEEHKIQHHKVLAPMQGIPNGKLQLGGWQGQSMKIKETYEKRNNEIKNSPLLQVRWWAKVMKAEKNRRNILPQQYIGQKALSFSYV